MAAPKKRSRRRNRSRQPENTRLAQHFFSSASIAHRIIDSLDLKNHQTVLELGAGEGFFTELLAPEVRTVTAIDIDPRLISRLKARFENTDNVRIIRKGITSTVDYGDYDVVFGDIPFNRTADVFRKVIKPPIRFDSCHLIVQTEAAYRLLGSARPTEMAVLAYPLVEVQLGMNIPRRAYRPQPSVNSGVLHIRTRLSQLISVKDYLAYSIFVKSVMRSGVRRLSRVVGSDISYSVGDGLAQG